MILEKLSQDVAVRARSKQAGVGSFLGELFGKTNRAYQDAKNDLGEAANQAGAKLKELGNAGIEKAMDAQTKLQDAFYGGIGDFAKDFENAYLDAVAPPDALRSSDIARLNQVISDKLTGHGARMFVTDPIRNSPQMLNNLISRGQALLEEGRERQMRERISPHVNAGFVDPIRHAPQTINELENFIRDSARNAGTVAEKVQEYARASKANDLAGAQHAAEIANLNAADSAVLEQMLANAGTSLRDFVSGSADTVRDALKKVRDNFNNASDANRALLGGAGGLTAALALLTLLKRRGMLGGAAKAMA